jgi:hypothetical protein
VLQWLLSTKPQLANILCSEGLSIGVGNNKDGLVKKPGSWVQKNIRVMGLLGAAIVMSMGHVHLEDCDLMVPGGPGQTFIFMN